MQATHRCVKQSAQDARARAVVFAHSSVSSAGVSLGVTKQAFMCVPGAMISVFMVILPENRLDRLEAATSLQDLAALPGDVIRDLRWQKNSL